ncbi:S-layer homology domain-containing protein [Vallitalea sp.]|jgi:hypothetical protein|uniref:S-layer homology domain-containing protein n=1 Tax=Vallitalea sp. TaxID=1882829 RepID=UPI0025FF7917|nr:S-layer homology domain-containing protein [Vallitalea sp.]MCT4688738.1 S-layer homology domain-containing protein [Vallitalea sp.]
MKLYKRWVASMLLVTMVFSTCIQSNAEVMKNNYEETVSNKFIEYTINSTNGRFSIKTVKGLVNREDDDNQSLLYEDIVPDTSFTTFRINGKDYIYGNKYDFLKKDGQFKYVPQTVDKSNQSTWKIADIEITQKITIVDDEKNPNVGNVKVTYHVKNTSKKEVDIGARVLLDTMLGANDSASITLPGMSQFIHKETRIDGANVPIYWKAMDDLFAPQIVSYGVLGGWGNEKPDSIIIGHWDGLSKTKWDYSVNTDLDFTSKYNKYGTADSAVALMWNPNKLEPSGERVYETYYGLGDFSTVGDDNKFSVKTFAPDKLNLNSTKTGYIQNEFEVGVEIDNTLTGAGKLTNVEAQVEFSYGVKLKGGERKTKKISSIEAGNMSTISWKVNPMKHYSYSIVRYKIIISADNLSNNIEKIGNIIIPSLSGEAPKINFINFSPDIIHYEDTDTNVTVIGNGLQLLMVDDNWKVYAENTVNNNQIIIPRNNITIRNNQTMVIKVPDALKVRGEYRLYVEYSQYDKKEVFCFKKTLKMTNDIKYMSRKYGILLIEKIKKEIKNDNNQIEVSYSYGFIEGKNEKDIKELRKGKDIILEIRGEMKKSDNKYTVIGKKSTINSFITYTYSDNSFDRMQPLVIEKKKRDIAHEADYITINGRGNLSIPNLPFWNQDFYIELVDGISYSLSPEKEENEDDKNEVKIIFPSLKFVQNIDGFPIRLNNAVIRNKGISFGGFLGLNFGNYKDMKKKSENNNDDNKNKKSDNNNNDNDEEDDDHGLLKFGIDVEDIRFGYDKYNKFNLQGIKGEGEIGLPSNLIPGLDLGASARLAIDTFDNFKIEAEVEIKFEVIEANGLISMKLLDVGGAKIYIPDKVVFSAGGEPGIPIIPAAPVVFIKKLGGGFEGLYDTLAGNFKVLPPLTLIAICGVDIAKVFEGDDITLKASPRGLSLSGDLKIAKFKILKHAELAIDFADRLDAIAFKMSASAQLEAFDILTGNVYMTFGIDTLKHGNLGPVSIAGGGTIGVKVPEVIPFIGGLNIGNIDAGISDESVYGVFHILHIPLGIKYKWGDSMPVLSASANGISGINNLGKIDCIDDNSNYEGTIIFGDNIKRIGSSKTCYASLGDIYMTPNNRPLVIASIGKLKHTITIPENQKYALIEVDYEGDEPNLTVTSPDGPYLLNKGVNYMLQEIKAEDSSSGKLEKRAYISIVNPTSGSWIVESKNKNQPIDTVLMDVKPLPKLNSVEVKDNNNTLDVVWQTEDADNTVISLYLASDKQDAGKIIAKDLPASNGKSTVSIPDSFASGEYYVRGEIKKDQTTYNSVYSSTKINIVNKNEPNKPTNLVVNSKGNGMLGLTWNKSSDADGYYIQVLNENGEELPEMGVIQLKENINQALVGGKYKYKKTGKKDIIEGNTGLIPGKTYKISLAAYKVVDGRKHITTPIISEKIALPIPKPATLNVAFEKKDGILQQKVDDTGSTYYICNNDKINIAFSANQNVETTVYINNKKYKTIKGNKWSEPIKLQEGETNIIFEANNNNGDTSKTGLRIISDKTPPDLKIESPSNGDLIENSIITVKGVAEVDSKVIVNNKVIQTNAEGLFETVIPMEEYMNREITVTVEDEALNKTIYKATVFNSTIKKINNVKIQPPTSVMGINISKQFTLIAVDKDAKEYAVDNKLVKWSLLSGDGIAQISDEGMLKTMDEGEVIVKASYYISKKYAYEDAIIIQVKDGVVNNEIAGIEISPSQVKMYTNEKKELRVYKVSNDLRREKIKDNLIKWSIVSGKDVVNIEKNGRLSALKEGVAVIRASYLYKGILYKNASIIKVVKKPVYNYEDGSNNKHEKEDNIDSKILNIIKNIIIAEKNIKLIEVKKIEKQKNTTINVDKKIKITIPLQEVLGDVGIGVGKVLDTSSYVNNNIKLYSDIYEIILDQPVHFEKPVKLQIQYNPNEIKDVSKLAIYYFNEITKKWEYVGGKIDTKNNIITVELDHFSKYALVSDKKMINMEDINGRWSQDIVYRLISKGIINGVKVDNKYYYYPKRTITRLEFAKLAVEASNVETEIIDLSNIFEDEDQIHKWGLPYVSTLYKHSWINGITVDNKQFFKPKRQITRAEAAVLLGKILKMEKDTKPCNFKDYENIPEWARDYINILVSKEIINGYPDNTFRPNDFITREEAASMIEKFNTINNKKVNDNVVSKY